MVLGIVEVPASRMHCMLCSRGTLTHVDRVSFCEDWIILTSLFSLSVVAPPRHESPEYFTRGRRSCPADGLGVRVQLLLTYEIESDLDLVGKPAAPAAEPTGNYIYIVLTPCGTMSPRRYVRRSAPAPSSEVPEEAGSSEVRELRAQVSALTGIVHRQESRFEQLQGLMERHFAAATAAATEGPRPPPASVPPAASGSTTPDATALEAERERALAALEKFRKFNPPTFEGEKVEPWMVESWVDSMETLFEDLYTLERDKVYLATHCLERTAKVWWKRIKRNRASDLPPLTWDEFRGLFYVNYFPDNEKKKLQEQFRKLKQGSRTVAEYEREFSHIIDCVPDVVRDDRDRADWFERGLRADIYRAVHILKLTAFAEVLDRALWAEQGNTHIREEREASERDGGKKRAQSNSGAQTKSRNDANREVAKIEFSSLLLFKGKTRFNLSISMNFKQGSKNFSKTN
uniref:Retrotransposon gag domain-containing protein n=1 Tax=Ananas comosus var. bracteatus TaxID=296719 RepID=A0A6V7NTC5_ANACO|nr:unnamed protein product [Ananas comosus var. bracteatus]